MSDPIARATTRTCEVCGKQASFKATPTTTEHMPPDRPEQIEAVDLCAECIAEGVPPGWVVTVLSATV